MINELPFKKPVAYNRKFQVYSSSASIIHWKWVYWHLWNERASTTCFKSWGGYFLDKRRYPVSKSVQAQSKDYPRTPQYAEKRRGTKITGAIKQGGWEMEAQEKAIIFAHSSQPWKWQWEAWVCCHKEEKKRQVKWTSKWVCNPT